MESERSDSLIGIDCGASKVLYNQLRSIPNVQQFQKESIIKSIYILLTPIGTLIINLHHLMFKLMKITANLS